MVTANDFWAGSQNGRAMVVMLCRRGRSSVPGQSRGAGNVELVRDICEWLVGVRQQAIVQDNIQRGATLDQAKAAAANTVSGVQHAAEGIGDSNTESAACSVIDYCFKHYQNAGPAAYNNAMAWFANELRKKVIDDLSDLPP